MYNVYLSSYFHQVLVLMNDSRWAAHELYSRENVWSPITMYCTDYDPLS